MRILMAASEAVPFAKTGGLADVVSALPKALHHRGIDARIVIPLYGQIDRYEHRLFPLLRRMDVQWNGETLRGEVMRAILAGDDPVPVYFIQQDSLFRRAGLYHEGGRDYIDNDRRFAFFCQAALWALKGLDWQPDIIHLHDWQAGLIAPLLRYHPSVSNDAFYKEIKTVFTIHNLAYQGIFGAESVPNAQLPWSLFTPTGLEYHRRASFLKAGIVYSDFVTTVSPTYAREISREDEGLGMDGVLAARGDTFTGILNGIDPDAWNPATDRHIPAPYTAGDLSGKAACKRELAEAFELDLPTQAPVFGIVSRLVDQKGLDLVAANAERLLAEGAGLVVLGTGDAKYESFFTKLASDHPGSCGAVIAYREGLAHLVEAGSDFFLMPSQFEPSGLNQLYSMRYGTPPIVRRVGGLADSVTDAAPGNVASGDATGFTFSAYKPEALWDAIQRALDMYRDSPADLEQLRRNGMQKDWSWTRSAAAYESVYRTVLAR